MEKAQHTPGPWHAILDHDGRHHDFPIMSDTGNKDDNGRGKVASVWRGKGHHFEEGMCIANARLIAAAPALLTEAYRNLEIMRSCFELVKLFHKDSIQKDILESQIIATHAAIAKAEGK